VSAQNQVLVVDDQEEMTESLVKNIAHAYPQFHVTGLTDGLQALQWIHEHSTDMLITDLRMPKYGGLEVIMETLAQNPQTPIIAMSAMAVLQEVRMVADRFTSIRLLAKPFLMGELFDTMDSLLSHPPESVARGFQPASILQVVHLEGRSCRIELMTPDLCGELCFESGELKHARASGMEGEEAVISILGMRDPVIKLYKGQEGYPKNVQLSLQELFQEYGQNRDVLAAV
jgi:CheY-like chemotaxis protein